MSKGINWMKSFCSAITMVSSPKGGRHFHMLCALSRAWNPRFSKGVNFDVKYLNQKKRSPFAVPDANEIQDSLKWQHVFETQRQRILNRIVLKHWYEDKDGIHDCSHHFRIAVMISEYFRLKENRITRLNAKTEHETHIKRVLDYLETNLNENDLSDGCPEQYIHYYVKLP